MDASDFHGKVSPLYLAKAATIFSRLKQLSYAKLNVAQGNCILDVGCGPGIDVINLAEQVGTAGRVIGFDHDFSMLDEARRKIMDTWLDRVVSVVHGNALALPFMSGYFDNCRSERLFMHLVKPDQVLAEMVRVTRPGGKIVVVDTDWSSLSIDNPYPKIERALADYRISHVLNNGYSGRSLYRQFREQGLSDVKADVFPICLTDIELFDYISMQQAIEDQALADRCITHQELGDWRAALNKAAEQGCFFSSASVVMVSATKPFNNSIAVSERTGN